MKVAKSKNVNRFAIKDLIKEIDKIKVNLSPEQKNDLLKEYRKLQIKKMGDTPLSEAEANRWQWIRDQMLFNHMPWIMRLATAFSNRGVDIEDLIHEGMNGFLKGLDKYDPEAGMSLLNFSKAWIETEISVALAKFSGTIKISRGMQNKIGRIFRTRSKIAQEKGISLEDVNNEEVAEILDMSVEEIQNCIEIDKIRRFQNIDDFALDKLSLDSENNLKKSLGMKNNNTGSYLASNSEMINDIAIEDSSMVRQDKKEGIIDFLQTTKAILGEKQYEFIKLRWGLKEDGTTQKPMTLRELSENWHGEGRTVSKEAVRQYEEKVIERLTKKMDPEQLRELLQTEMK